MVLTSSRTTPSRILVINVSRIGDTLLATPALRAIATHYPNARLTCLGHPKRIEVLQHLPFVHAVERITKISAGFRGWFRQGRYDLAFVYGYDEALVTYALRVANKVVAFRQQSEALNEKLFRAVVPPPFQSKHAVDLALELPGALGVPAAGRRLAYRVTPHEAEWALQTLAHQELRRRSPRIGLQIASFPTKGYRDWPIERFAHLCERILGKWPNAHFLIFGGSEERARTEQLQRTLGAAATLYAGKLSLRQTAALMGALQLYIGVDTGPTHIMSTLDIPMVALYHSSSPGSLTGPLDHPCAQMIDHPRSHVRSSTEDSMAEVSVETVFAAVERALEDKPAP